MIFLGYFILWMLGVYASFEIHRDVKGEYTEGSLWQDFWMVFFLWWILIPIQIINHPKVCHWFNQRFR